MQEHPELEIEMHEGAPLTEDQIIEKAKDADALIPVIPDKITPRIIDSCKNLKIIACYSVGFNHIDLDTATKNGVYVSNTPGNLTEAVAEHSMALILGIGRQLVEADKYVREGNYAYWDPMIFLSPRFTEKTLGIIGFGRIGQHLAKMAYYGFKMNILYHDVMPNTADHFVFADYVSLDHLLENSDIISLHVPLLDSTRHLINEAALHKMKPTAYLINTSRGPVVDEAALVQALQDGVIAGAGLDVFEEEPKIHEGLAELKNVVLSPHVASATREARIEMATMAAKNVIQVLVKNEPPKNCVNKQLLGDPAKVSSLA